MKKDFAKDLKGNFLSNKDEIKIIYEGPSFDGQMEISNLTTQLKSTEFLIKEIISEYYQQRGYKEKADVKIYLKLERGSFEEIISIILDKEVLRGIVIITFGTLLGYYLSRKKEEKARETPKTSIKIEKMVNNIKIVNNLKHIIDPLEKKGDRIRIVSTKKPKMDTKITFPDKKIFKDALKELESEVKIEYSEEDFFGKLRAVDLDKEKYRFSLEGNEAGVPVSFEKGIDSKTIRQILDKRIKIKAIATQKNEELEQLKILDFKEKRRKSLTDFSSKKK